MTLNQLFWKLTKEKFTLHEVNFGGAAKISTIFYQQCYISTHNPDADVTYQAVNVFSPDKCFIYFISDVPHCIRWNQHNTVCAVLVKVDVLDTSGAMLCLYFRIVFLLFLWRYRILFTHLFKTARSCSLMDWFLTSWTLKIISLLNLNEYQC